MEKDKKAIGYMRIYKEQRKNSPLGESSMKLKIKYYCEICNMDLLDIHIDIFRYNFLTSSGFTTLIEQVEFLSGMDDIEIFVIIPDYYVFHLEKTEVLKIINIITGYGAKIIALDRYINKQLNCDKQDDLNVLEEHLRYWQDYEYLNFE